MKTIAEVRDQFEGLFPKPSTEPWFPDNITEVGDDTLGELLTLYTLWSTHVSEQVAIDDAERGALHEEIEIDRAIELVRLAEDEDLKSKFSAKEDRLAYVTSRKHIAAKTKQMSDLTAVVKMEKAWLDNLEKRFSCVSREVTRRGKWN